MVPSLWLFVVIVLCLMQKEGQVIPQARNVHPAGSHTLLHAVSMRCCKAVYTFIVIITRNGKSSNSICKCKHTIKFIRGIIITKQHSILSIHYALFSNILVITCNFVWYYILYYLYCSCSVAVTCLVNSLSIIINSQTIVQSSGILAITYAIIKALRCWEQNCLRFGPTTQIWHCCYNDIAAIG